MNRLAFDVGTDAAPDFTNGIPMWGELPNQAVGEGFSPSGAPQEVTMIRAVAKFTLINPLESDLKGFFYYYNDLRLYNYRAKGRIAPDNYNVTGKQVNTPTVPVGARRTRYIHLIEQRCVTREYRYFQRLTKDVLPVRGGQQEPPLGRECAGRPLSGYARGAVSHRL